MNKWLIVLVVFIIVGAIGAGFWITGGPVYQRKIAWDNDRAARVMKVKDRVTSFYREKETLPDDYAQLEAWKHMDPDDFEDPQQNKPFEYQKVDETHYQLCATYLLDSDARRNRHRYYRNHLGEHQAGYFCHDLEVKPPKK